MLAIDGAEGAAARDHRAADEVARHHERFLVGDGDGLARLQRGDGGQQTGGPARAREHDVDAVGDGHLLHREPGGARRRDGVVEGGVARGGEDVAGPQLGDLLGEAGGVAPGGQRRDLEAIGQLADDVDGLASDGAGGAEDGDALGSHPFHRSLSPRPCLRAPCRERA